MFSRAQSTIENMIILAVAIFILIAFLSTAWEQITMQHNTQQIKVGSLALQTLTKEINDVYFLGPGSKKEVLIILPDLIDSNYSSIENSTLSLRVAGTDLFSTTKVPVRGTWPNSSGSYVFTIEAFNDFVGISTNLLSFSPTQMNKVLIQDSSTQSSLFITNSKSESVNYDFSIIFSSSVASISSSDEGTLEFTSGEQKEITIDFYCSNSSAGNYSGLLFFEGDTNVTFPVNLTCLSGQTKLTIFPNSKIINATKGTSTSERFLVCNNSSNNFSSASIIIDGNLRQQSTTDFNSAILANTCEPLDLNIFSNDDGNYSGTISISASGYTATSTIALIISPSFGSNYYFASVDNNTLHQWFDFNGFVSKRLNDLNYWVASGELDWNGDGNFEVNGSSWDKNLIAYYKFNDLNADGYVIDYARGNNGTLEGDANTAAKGMWDSNALWLDGVNDYVNISNVSGQIGVNGTIIVWFKGTQSSAAAESVFSLGDTDGDSVFYIAPNSNSTSSCSGEALTIVEEAPASNRICWIPSNELSLEDGHWHHLAIIGGSSYRLFIDGDEKTLVVGSGTNTGNIGGLNRDNAFVGVSQRNSLALQGFYKGNIDELKVYNGLLSNEEILTDYNKFLEAKFVDVNVVNAGSSVDWNTIKINSDVNYTFGSELNSNETYFWDENLVALWHLNAGTEKAFTDEVNSLVLVPVSFDNDENVSGLWDTNSFNLDGSTDYLYADYNGLLISGELTASIWIKFDVAPNPTQYQNFFVFAEDYKGYSILNNSTSGLAALIGNGSTWKIAQGPKAVANKWYHLVLTQSNSSQIIKFYIDGSLYSSVSSALMTFPSTSTRLYVGKHYSAAYYVDGTFEDMAVWNRVLNAEEIKNLYRKGVAKLDLNVYSCSDALCNTKTSSQYISDVNNNYEMALSLSNSQYLGYEAYFKPITALQDHNAGMFWVGAYLQDVNISYGS